MGANRAKEILSKNLSYYIKSRGTTQTELCNKLNIPKMTMNNWVNGNTYPRPDKLQLLADHFGIRRSDLTEEKTDSSIPLSDYNFFPTAISAGLPFEVDGITNSKKISIPDTLMGRWAGDKDVFITKIFGDSMDKIMPDGSLIAIKPTPIESLKNGDIVVFSDGNEYSVKHYYKQDNKLIFKPNSHNSDHHEQHFSINDKIEIHGKVIMWTVTTD